MIFSPYNVYPDVIPLQVKKGLYLCICKDMHCMHVLKVHLGKNAQALKFLVCILSTAGFSCATELWQSRAHHSSGS